MPRSNTAYFDSIPVRFSARGSCSTDSNTATPGGLLRDVSAGPHQIVKAVHGFLRTPRDAAQQQHAEQRVVEAPREVPRDRHEHAPLAALQRPEQRLRLVVLLPPPEHPLL